MAKFWTKSDNLDKGMYELAHWDPSLNVVYNIYYSYNDYDIPH